MFGKKRLQDSGIGRQATRSRRRGRRSSSSLQPPASSLRHPRRGVLLLVVLSVLVLFMMLGTAFLLTAKQAEKAGKAVSRGAIRTARTDVQGGLLDEAVLQLVRDTKNPLSVLRGHSLLADMYGNDGLKAEVNVANWAGGGTNGGPTGGQMLELEIVEATVADLYGNPLDMNGNPIPPSASPPPPRGLSTLENSYNGLVLTFLSGPARGQSTRIVGYLPAATTPPRPPILRVMNFEIENGAQVTDPTGQLGKPRVLINGRPFNGTGKGLNAYAFMGVPRLNAQDLSLKLPSGDFPELALLPNPAFLLPGAVGAMPNIASLPYYAPGAGMFDPNGRGGADESYDAVDFQNMPLAYVPGAALIETVLPDFSGTALPPDLGATVLPSFHRPELINYWATRLLGAAGGDIRDSDLAKEANDISPPARMLLRRILMRPNWLDHPNFTGGNPEMIAAENNGQRLARMVYGPWDVDNDNDGVRDSVWVDLGLPVMAGADGRMVKPLVSLLVIDMDGRLNVNAHGTADLADTERGTGIQDLNDVMADGVRLASSPGQGGSVESDDMPRGMAMGPADISLESAIGDDDFERLLTGFVFPVNGQMVYFPGRYGPDDGSTIPGAGVRRAGKHNQFDLLSQIGMTGFPRRSNQLSDFANPPDLRARYGMGLNDFGQPVFEGTLKPIIDSQTGASPADDDLLVDSPYELNLSQTTAAGVHGWQANRSAADAPFSVAELEKVLRIYDADAGSLPPRLALLAGIERTALSTGVDPSDRLKITTDQHDLPAPSVSMPTEMLAMISEDPEYRRLPHSAAEILEMRVRAVLFDQQDANKFPRPLTGDLNNNGVTDADEVRYIVRRLLPRELADGKRINLNRPLGNGRDDRVNNVENGVVDEPGEGDANGNGILDPGEGQRMWPLNPQDPAMMAAGAAATAFAGVMFPLFATEVLPPDNNNPNGKLALIDHRQLLARDLYVTALMLTAPSEFGTQTPPTEADRELARSLAQWAANAVDFRDPDNIMTFFEYDVQPFNGWDDAIDGAMHQTYDPDGEVQYVWGAERPELVMTETFSMHDRRTDDGAQEDVYPAGGQPNITKTSNPLDPDRDLDYDQLVRPRGALFIELYNPWPPSPAANADTHDRTTAPGFDMGVDIGALSGGLRDPAAQVDPNASPVWRLAIYKRQTVAENEAGQWDPDAVDRRLHPRGRVNRYVYFAGRALKVLNPDGTPVIPHVVGFHNDPDKPPIPPVRPGRFMVVGSGKETSLGSGVYEAPIGDRKSRNPANARPQRRIELVTQAAATGNTPAIRMADVEDQQGQAIRDPAGNYEVKAPLENPNPPTQFSNGSRLESVPGDSSSSIASVAIIDRADNDMDTPRRLSLSEPARGYPRKFRAAEWNEAEGQYEAQGAPMAIDVPLDGPIGVGDEQEFRDQQGVDWPYDHDIDPVLTEIREAQAQGAQRDPGAFYGQIYLQRLANPLLPWNPAPGEPGYDDKRPVNPYMTVDAMHANLTVINSRGDDRGREEDDKAANEPRNNFASVQRGYTARTHNAQTQNFMPSIWGREAPTLVRARPGARGQDMLVTPRNEYRRMELQRTNDFWFNAVPSHTLGFLNRPMQNMDPAVSGAERQVRPVKPYEWLTWNNRPYTGAGELLMVPRRRSSQIMPGFTNGETPPPGWSAYDSGNERPQQAQAGPQAKSPFAHLLSFFYEDQGAAPLGGVKHLYRLLDYVHAPSLYVGTETWLNPSSDPANPRFGAPVTPGTTDPTDPRVNFQPPFNTVSQFRDPGKVNINTMPGIEVWEGLFHGEVKRDGSSDDEEAHAGPDFDDEFGISRRGYGPGNEDKTFFLDGSSPTFFANPFRASGAEALVPLASMTRSGVDATLLRSIGGTTGDPGPAEPKGDPLFSVNSGTPKEHNNEDRNAYFRYGPLVRMSSLTTTRSNVYAVWVTIGFFEVEPAPRFSDVQANFDNNQDLYNRVYPDGYQFGREAGSETGDVRRLRGFYILDRTLPAGFEPGADHNVENIIRLRRRIQ